MKTSKEFREPAIVRCIRRVRHWMGAGGKSALCYLDGDRAVEWSWVVAHLPRQPCRILDFGCVQSSLTAIAARLGHRVTAVDLRDIEYDMPNVVFRKGDINELQLGGESYDVVINCSTIEHVGLAGRYGSGDAPDGDMLAMKRLRSFLTAEGKMILTIPVGVDAVFPPYHRVYGRNRLNALLEGYTVIEEEYWTKPDMLVWRKCAKEDALTTFGSSGYYALGLFVLIPARQTRF